MKLVKTIPSDDVLIFRAAKAHHKESLKPEADPLQSEISWYAGKRWVHLYSSEKELCSIYLYYPKSAQLRRQ